MQEDRANTAIGYRLEAAKLGKLARSQTGRPNVLLLLHEALSWIQLAQNEEILMNAVDLPLQRPQYPQSLQ